MEANVPIVHVFGCVGAGKTKFIHHYWSTRTAFDIQDVYLEYHISPADLQNPGKYAQFTEALKISFDNYMRSLQESNQNFGIVESSGINRALNTILKAYQVLTIWIQPDFQLLSDQNFLKERPYAQDLNDLILSVWKSNQLQADLMYYADKDDFGKPIPADFKFAFIDQKTTPQKSEKENEIEKWKPYYNGLKYICPVCRAEFSKGPFLDIHLKRSHHPLLQN